MATINIIIQGEVQGVFFRATAKKVADELGISGWIKNTSDGNVEATASGDKQLLDKFVAWCYQGPPKASVKNVTVYPVESQQFSEFNIIR